MKPCDPTLELLIESGDFVYCHLYTITTTTGVVLRYPTSDRPVKYGGNTWDPSGVKVEEKDSRSTGHWGLGLDVDTWNVALIPRVKNVFTGTRDPDLIGSQSFIAAVGAGALDNADFRVDRAYFANWRGTVPFVPVGILTIFGGLVGDIERGYGTTNVVAYDYRILLKRVIPRRHFQSGCIHTLFDSGCQLLASDFDVAGTVGSGSTQSEIHSSIGAPGGSGTYKLGRVVFTDGDNVGVQRGVRDWSGGILKLLSPLPYEVAVGDHFTAYPGCDKTQTQCALFSNTVNYGGEPFIPVPEVAV